MLCHGSPRHRGGRGGGACGAVTADQTPVVAWPRTVKRSQSWALNLGFMACVLGMRPPDCFLPIHPSIQFWKLLGVGGLGGGSKIDPPFFWIENHESFGFFPFLVENGFPGPDSMEVVWGGLGRALVRFLHFLAIFGFLAVWQPR